MILENIDAIIKGCNDRFLSESTGGDFFIFLSEVQHE